MKESTEGGKEGGQEERHKQKERTEERRKAKFQERKNAVPALHRSFAVPNSATRTRTRVARVRAEYPNQLDYSGRGGNKKIDYIVTSSQRGFAMVLRDWL